MLHKFPYLFLFIHLNRPTALFGSNFTFGKYVCWICVFWNDVSVRSFAFPKFWQTAFLLTGNVAIFPCMYKLNFSFVHSWNGFRLCILIYSSTASRPFAFFLGFGFVRNYNTKKNVIRHFLACVKGIECKIEKWIHP